MNSPDGLIGRKGNFLQIASFFLPENFWRVKLFCWLSLTWARKVSKLELIKRPLRAGPNEKKAFSHPS